MMSDLLSQLRASLGGRYRIDRELGGGGMSRVFVAEEIALGRQVVLKVLPPDMAATVNEGWQLPAGSNPGHIENL